jgi:hypothetical protein
VSGKQALAEGLARKVSALNSSTGSLAGEWAGIMRFGQAGSKDFLGPKRRVDDMCRDSTP